MSAACQIKLPIIALFRRLIGLSREVVWCGGFDANRSLGMIDQVGHRTFLSWSSALSRAIPSPMPRFLPQNQPKFEILYLFNKSSKSSREYLSEVMMIDV